MMSKPAPVRGNCGRRWVMASLCAIPALAAVSSAARAEAIASDSSVSLAGDIAAQNNPRDRILHIGQPQVPFSEMEDGRHVTISRFGDLVGYPVSPVRKVAVRIQTAPGDNGPKAGRLSLTIPTPSARLTSTFGARRHPFGGGLRNHSGIDLAASSGTPVLASGSGLVLAARWQGGYGLLVALDHGGGVQTRYGHLSQLAVQEGEHVNKGDLVGYVGSTGRSTGPHLHYEVRENGMAIDPLRVTRR